MSRSRILFFACMGLAPILGVASARAADPATRPDNADKQQLVQQVQSMQDQMSQMQAQLAQTQAQLQKTQSQLQQTQVQVQDNSAATAQVIKNVMDDADKHSRMFSMTSGASGFDSMHGFYIQTDDGQSYFHPGILFQGDSSNILKPAYAWNTTGVVQLDLDGSVFSKDLTFAFAINEALGTPVEYAEIQYVFAHGVMDHDLAFEVGRFKNAAFKETSDIGDPDGLFVSESLAGDLLGGNAFGPQVDGVALNVLGDDQPLHASIEVNPGPINAADLLGTAVVLPKIGASGRVDYKFFGDWVDTTDLTGKLSGQHNLLDIGAGMDYLNAFSGSWYRFDVDAQYQFAQKFTAYAAAYFNNYEFDHTAVISPTARNDYGAVVEGGYMVTPSIQALARYSIVRSDNHFPGLGTGPTRVFNELGVGANYYFGPDGSWGNHLRFGIDLDYLPNGTIADPNLFYSLSTNDRAEWLIRGQFQFWI